jgi:hypothetical protein
LTGIRKDLQNGTRKGIIVLGKWWDGRGAKTKGETG